MQSTIAYTTVATIAAQSAWSTLCILDRQGRKDARKVARFTVRTYDLLTSPQAVQTYRSAWQLLQIACMVAVACGMSARALVDRLTLRVAVASDDRFIAAQQIPATEAVVVEPEAQPEILALPAPTAPAAPIALLPAPKPLRAEHSIVPFRRRPAAPTDAELVKWAKANRSLLSGLKVGKWSYFRKLRESERQAVIAAMQTAQQSA